MYKVMKIGGKDYKIEFAVEAALYDGCISATMELIGGIAIAASEKEIKGIIAGMANIPQTALTLFYAGLMEHHGDSGDRTVLQIADAKQLIIQYFKEHPGDSFYDVMNLMMDQMGEDGFFERVGLEKMMEKYFPEAMVEKDTKAVATIPQDHKSKTKKASGK
ncbi:hypothetical protein LI010_19930 [Enterocloster aldenensis]|uniref:hypothetical protein n=1 Tax=Enterocloster aldenensis TaxID=358742 RepID=UPI001D065C8C|nr:hypothetical protein [Enterocloster aldenensis]